MKAAKKPVSCAAEAYSLPRSIGSRFARMLLPSPWLEEVKVPTENPGLSILQRLKDAVLRLAGKFEEPLYESRCMRVKPGTALTDFYGCSYHVGKDGSLRLGVHHATLPDELLDDAGKPLRGRPRRWLLRKAKLLVQRFQRDLRNGALAAQPAEACPA